MNVAEEFVELQAQHQRLMGQHAVLSAQEAEKAKRREELRAKLKAAGVDPDRPEEELQRLEAEAKKSAGDASQKLDEFELQLKAAAGSPALPIETVNPPLTKDIVKSLTSESLDEIEKNYEAGREAQVQAEAADDSDIDI